MASNAPPRLPKGFQNWPAQRKFDYVAQLWELIMDDEQDLPVYPWQREAVEQAKVTLERSPEEALPWRQEHERLRARVHAHELDRREE